MDYRYIEINRHLRKMHSDIVDDTMRKIEALGGKVRQERASELLIINEELRASLVICRCHHTQGDDYRWKVRFDTGPYAGYHCRRPDGCGQ